MYMRILLFIFILLLMLMPGCAPKTAPEIHIPLDSPPCIEGIEREPYRQALSALSSSDASEPIGPNGYYVQAAALYCMSRHAKALKALEKSLELSPGHYDSLMLRATIYRETGKTDLAIKNLDQAALINTDAPEPLVEKGLIYLHRGAKHKANEAFLNAVKRSPRSTAAYVALGDAHASMGKMDDALNFYNRAIKLDPMEADAYAGRGLTFLDMEKYTHAAKDLDKAADLEPKYDSRLAVNRGYAHFYSGHYSSAALAFTAAIESDPVPPADIVTMRALSYFNAGKMEKAIEDAGRAIELAPEDAKMYYNRASFYYQSGDLEQALQDYDKAIVLEPEYYEALLNRGKIYFETGKRFRSIVDYNKAIETDPERVQGYIHRGASYVAAGMYVQAEKDFAYALDLDHGLLEIMIAMAELSSIRGDGTRRAYGSTRPGPEAMITGNTSWAQRHSSPSGMKNVTGK
jgi:tetratricopeptide (TPR) repeat protein